MKSKSYFISLLVVLALLLSVVPATAQTPIPGFSGPFRASSLIGYSVINLDGQRLGEVEDLLVYLGDSTTSGKIAYAIVGFGGFLGIGQNQVAVPMGALVMDEARAALLLPITATSLADAPTFDANALPDVSAPNWDANLRTYWTGTGLDTTGMFTSDSAAYGPPYRASRILGMGVVNDQGDKLGEVGDLVLQVGANTRAGRSYGVSIGYAVIRYGGFLGIGEDAVAVPLNAMTLDTAKNAFVLPITAEALRAAPRFQSTDIPGVAGAGWDADVRTYWSGLGYTMPAYQAGTATGAATEGGPYRASQILGYPVMSLTGDEVGTVEDLLVDFFPTDVATTSTPYLYDYGRVYYAVISVSSLAGAGPDMVVVPMSAMSLDPLQNAFVIEVSAADLANAPLFTSQELPMPGQAQWDANILNYWRGRGFRNLPSQPQVTMTETATPMAAMTITPAATVELTVTVAAGSPTATPMVETTTTATMQVTGTPAASMLTPTVVGTQTTGTAVAMKTITGTAQASGTPAASMLTPTVVGTATVSGTTTPMAAVTTAVEDAKMILEGRAVAEQFNCLSCHSTDGTKSVGPSFQGLYGSTQDLADGSSVEVNTEYLHRAIVEPDAQVVKGFSPGVMAHDFGQRLSEEQINAVIAYIESLM